MKFLEANEKKNFRRKPKYKCRKETKRFSKKTNILEEKLKQFF